MLNKIFNLILVTALIFTFVLPTQSVRAEDNSTLINITDDNIHTELDEIENTEINNVYSTDTNTYAETTSTNEHYFTPSNDSFVRGGIYNNDNYGSLDNLQIKNVLNPITNAKYIRKAYMMFDFSSFDSQNISSAILQFYVSQVSSDNNMRINFYTIDDTWNETEITWANAPAKGDLIGSLDMQAQAVGSFTNYEIDITNYVQQNMLDKKVSILIESTGVFVKICSKENEDSSLIPRITITSSNADKSILMQKIAEYQGLSDYRDFYTEESWLAFETAMNNALIIKDDSEASQEQVDDAVAVMDETVTNLERLTGIHDEYDELRIKYYNYLTGGTNFNPSDEKYVEIITEIDDNAEKYWDSMNINYVWDDLEASSAKVPGESLTSSANRVAANQIRAMFNRLKDMTLAYSTYGSKFYQNEQIKEDIINGLNWIYTNRYNENISYYGNWYSWQIAMTQTFSNILILLYDDLEPQQILNFSTAIDYHLNHGLFDGVSDSDLKGANLVDIAQKTILNGIIAKNADWIQEATGAMVDTLSYVTPRNNNDSNESDGFYSDGSFIQHWNYPYAGGYGSVFISKISNIFWMLSDSTWEPDYINKDNVYKFIFDTFEPNVYKTIFVNPVVGRGASRRDGLVPVEDLVKALLLQSEFANNPYEMREKSLVKYYLNNIDIDQFEIWYKQKIDEIMNDTSISPRQNYEGNYQFYNQDTVSHHRADWTMALRMSSSRISNYESINLENRRGWYLGDGMTYLYVDDDDYGQYYLTTVDQHRMPGTTVDIDRTRPQSPKISHNTGIKDFVGGVEFNDLFGVSAMDFQQQYNDMNVNAKKSWFMFDNEVVALGSGINSTSGRTIETIVENRKLDSHNNNIFTVDGVDKSLTNGLQETMRDINWAYLEGTGGYYFPDSATIDVVREKRANENFVINEQIRYIGTDLFEDSSLDLETWALKRENSDNWRLENGSMIITTQQGTLAGAGEGTTNNLLLKQAPVGNYYMTTMLDFIPSEDGQEAGLIVYTDDDNYITLAKSKDTIIWKNEIDGITIDTGNIDTGDGTLYLTIEKQGEEYSLYVSTTSDNWQTEAALTKYNFFDNTKIGIYAQGGESTATNEAVFNEFLLKHTNYHLTMWKDHGIDPVNDKYSYVLLPTMEKDDIGSYADEPDIDILANTSDVHAVRENSLNLLGATFWNAGSVEYIEAYAPCVVMAEDKEEELIVAVSDPSHKKQTVSLTINKSASRVITSDPEVTVLQLSPSITMQVDVSENPGKTFNIKFALGDTVEPGEDVPVDSISLDQDKVVKEGRNVYIKAVIEPKNASNKNIIWQTSDEEIAVVDNGIITALKPGDVVITAITEDGNKQATCNVTVQPYQQDEFDILRDKWIKELIGDPTDRNDQDVHELIEEWNVLTKEAWNTMNKSLLRTYLWEDYEEFSVDKSTTFSYRRLETMAKAFLVGNDEYRNNTELLNDILEALEWMYDNRYNESKQLINWWHYEIGSPRALNNIVLLLYDYLTPEQINKYMDVINYFQPDPTQSFRRSTSGPRKSVGANRVDTSKVAAIRGIIIKDSNHIQAARDALSDVFDYVTHGDGFYEDGSFVQHNDIPYTGTYGNVLIGGVASLLNLLADSNWEVIDQDVENIYINALNAFEPIIYKGASMDMINGRAVSRQEYQDHGHGHGIIESLIQLAQSAPEKYSMRLKQAAKYWIGKDTFKSYFESVKDIYSYQSITAITYAKELLQDRSVITRGELVIHKQFSNMDRIVHRRPGYAFGLSMHSNRIQNYETINNENARGWYTGDGMTYLYNNDLSQYSDDYWPTINPYKMPGTTEDTSTPRNNFSGAVRSTKTWVGGTVIDDIYGIAGMDFESWNRKLNAKKSWFMFDDEIVALGADINGELGTIETTIENRKINGNNLFTVDGVQKGNTLGWSETMEDVSWMHLQGNEEGADIGYYLPEPSQIYGVREERDGNWKDINYSGTDNNVTRNYMTLSLNHGTNPMDANYAYVLLPNKSSQQTKKYAHKPDIQILENSKDAQGVKENSLNITGINFWEDKIYTVSGITTNRKSSIMIKELDGKELEISVADPTHNNTGTIEVEIDKEADFALWHDSRVTVTQLSPTIKLSIDVNKANGATITSKFSLDGQGVPWENKILIHDDFNGKIVDSNIDSWSATDAADTKAIYQKDVWQAKNNWSGIYELGSGNTGIVTVEYNFIPLKDDINAVVGQVDNLTEVNGYNDLAIIFRAMDGKFDARNGSQYECLQEVSYELNQHYRVRVVMNLDTNSYDVYVTPENGVEVKIAENYAFRTDAPIPSNIGKVVFQETGTNSCIIDNYVVQGKSIPDSLSQCMEIEDNNEDASVVVQKIFDPIQSKLIVEWKLMNKEVDSKYNFELLGESKTVISIKSENGSLISEQVDGVIQSIDPYKWYTIKLDVNILSGQYDIYINKILTAENIAFDNSSNYIDTIRYATDTYQKSLFNIDDVNVSSSPIQLEEIALDKHIVNIRVNERAQINATILPEYAENKKVIWRSMDDNIATVDQNGMIRGRSEGTVVIVAEAQVGDVRAEMLVQVSKKPYVPVYDDEEDEEDDEDTNQNNKINKDGIVKVKPLSHILGTGDRIAKASVTKDIIDKAFVSVNNDVNTIKKIIIQMDEVLEAEQYSLELPKDVLTANKMDKKIEVNTPIGVITLANNMFDSKKVEKNNFIEIVISKADKEKIKEDIKNKIGNKPIIDIHAEMGGKLISWDNPNSPVTVSINYQPTVDEVKDTEHIVVWYINNQGKVVPVPNAKYDSESGKVTFRTTHFSQYAIAYNKKTFKDIEELEWAKKAIEVMASKGIINGTSVTTYNPKDKISRGEFISLLVRTLELDSEFTSNFDDVKVTDYFYKTSGTAKAMGITNGVGDNQFKAHDKISRQDMMVLIERALKITDKISDIGSIEISNFDDSHLVSDYAREGVSVLIKEEIILGNDKKINPLGTATRAETAVIMYRILNKYM